MFTLSLRRLSGIVLFSLLLIRFAWAEQILVQWNTPLHWRQGLLPGAANQNSSIKLFIAG